MKLYPFLNNQKYFFLQIALCLLISLSLALPVSAKAFETGTLLEKTNESRRDNNLEPLILDEGLTKAALLKANHMIEHQYFNHFSPTGQAPWDFIDMVKYEYDYAGENLAIGFDDEGELHNAWMLSKSHRENILSTNFTEIGFAIVEGEYKGARTILVVQMFANPLKLEEERPEEQEIIGLSSSDKVVLKPELVEVKSSSIVHGNSEKGNYNLIAASLMVIIVIITGLFSFRKALFGSFRLKDLFLRDKTGKI